MKTPNRDPRAKRASKKASFLRAFRKLGGRALAAEACGLHRNTVYEWERDDAAFHAAVLEAEEKTVEELEHIARKRAAAKSDMLMMFMLNGGKPEKYRQNAKVEHSGEVSVKVINYSLKAEGAVPQKKK